MSKRGRYLGGHTLIYPGRSYPASESETPAAVARSHQIEAGEDFIRQRVLSDLSALDGEIHHVEMAARDGDLTPADALVRLDALDPERRFAELIEFARAQKFRRPLYQLDRRILNLRWLRQELLQPSEHFMFRNQPWRAKARNISATPKSVSPEEWLVDSLAAALDAGLFSTQCRPAEVTALDRLRFGYAICNYIRALQPPYRLPARAKSLLLECEQIAIRTPRGELSQYRRAALADLQATYVRKANWIGRGRAFCWTDLP